MQNSSRPRYSGPTESLVECIAPHVSGASWLVYGEKPTKSKLELSVVMKHATLLRSLAKLFTSMVFKQGELENAMLQSRARQQAKWKDFVLPDEETSWDRVMARRLMTLCRHFAQGHRQGRTWALEIMEDEGGKEVNKLGKENTEKKEKEKPDEKKEKDKDKDIAMDKDKEQWFFWDPEGKVAWRQIGEQKTASKEVIVPDGAKETDCMMAVWSNGDKWEVPSVTVSDWVVMTGAVVKTKKGMLTEEDHEKHLKEKHLKEKHLKEKPKEKPKENPKCIKRKKDIRRNTIYWTGETKQKKKLEIKGREDRGRLMVLNEDKRMILGVKVEVFGGSDERAAEFLQPLAVSYQDGKIKKAELYMHRDKLLNERQENIDSVVTPSSGGSCGLSSGTTAPPSSFTDASTPKPPSSTEAPSTPSKRRRIYSKKTILNEYTTNDVAIPKDDTNTPEPKRQSSVTSPRTCASSLDQHQSSDDEYDFWKNGEIPDDELDVF